VDEPVPRAFHGEDQLIELQVQRLGIAVLRSGYTFASQSDSGTRRFFERNRRGTQVANPRNVQAMI